MRERNLCQSKTYMCLTFLVTQLSDSAVPTGAFSPECGIWWSLVEGNVVPFSGASYEISYATTT